jgi:hypothetical protein
MRFWPRKATDESAPIEPYNPTYIITRKDVSREEILKEYPSKPMSLEQALKEYPDKVQLLEAAPVHYPDPVKPKPRRRKK